MWPVPRLKVTLIVGLTVPAILAASACTAPPDASPPTFVDPSPTVAASSPPPELPELPLHPQNDVTGTTPFWSWALVDRRTGTDWGSPNAEEVSRTASMVKAWLAALYLRENPEPSQSWVSTLSRMIRDSDNAAGEQTYQAVGGNHLVTDAMMSVCGVSATMPFNGVDWGSTTISSRQQALLGACIAGGRVADARWTAWLLDEMRQVRGGGDFGIRQAFPEDVRHTIAIKNGWTQASDGTWYVNCLAIGKTWVLVVETRSRSLGAGTTTCRQITEQLLAPATRPLPTPSV